MNSKDINEIIEKLGYDPRTPEHYEKGVKTTKRPWRNGRGTGHEEWTTSDAQVDSRPHKFHTIKCYNKLEVVINDSLVYLAPPRFEYCSQPLQQFLTAAAKEQFKSHMRPVGICLEYMTQMKGNVTFGIKIDNTWSAVNVQRLAWVIDNASDVPTGKRIINTCNNRKCCKPEHLKVVTHSEINGSRKVASGTDMRGKKHPNNKLADAIPDIDKLYWLKGWTQHRIADKYGVTDNAINAALHRILTYRYVDKPSFYGCVRPTDSTEPTGM